MKSRIFMYLFVFALLFILFQYVNSKNYFKVQTASVEKLEAEVSKLKDSTQQLLLDKLDLQYFALENNDDALEYYYHLGLENPASYVADKLLETNEQKGDNPLVPYAGMTGSPMKINKIKVLNHKWIIADFSDGKHWGEIFIKYELKDNLSVDFTLVEHLLYTRSNN